MSMLILGGVLRLCTDEFWLSSVSLLVLEEKLHNTPGSDSPLNSRIFGESALDKYGFT